MYTAKTAVLGSENSAYAFLSQLCLLHKVNTDIVNPIITNK